MNASVLCYEMDYCSVKKKALLSSFFLTKKDLLDTCICIFLDSLFLPPWLLQH